MIVKTLARTDTQKKRENQAILDYFVGNFTASSNGLYNWKKTFFIKDQIKIFNLTKKWLLQLNTSKNANVGPFCA